MSRRGVRHRHLAPRSPARERLSGAMDAILRADYGDKDQRAANEADAARKTAAGAGVRGALVAFGTRRRPPAPTRIAPFVVPSAPRVADAPRLVPRRRSPRPGSRAGEAPARPRDGARRAVPPPPGRAYGEPHGDFNRRPPPRAVVKWRSPAGRPTTTLAGEPVPRAPARRAPSPAFDRPKPSARNPRSRARTPRRGRDDIIVRDNDGGTTPRPGADASNVTCPSLPALGAAMRDAASAKAPPRRETP